MFKLTRHIPLICCYNRIYWQVANVSSAKLEVHQLRVCTIAQYAVLLEVSAKENGRKQNSHPIPPNRMADSLRAGIPPRYVTSHRPGQLSLAITPVGRRNEYWQWFRSPLEKKLRVLRNSRLCFQDCWHSDLRSYAV